MKQFGKREMHNNILMCEAKEYSQIVLPSSIHNIVYNELHNKMEHLRTDKVFDLARRHFYWPQMYRDTELDTTKRCQ